MAETDPKATIARNKRLHRLQIIKVAREGAREAIVSRVPQTALIRATDYKSSARRDNVARPTNIDYRVRLHRLQRIKVAREGIMSRVPQTTP